MLKRKKKPVPRRAGSSYECLFIMHGQFFHAHSLGKLMPPTEGPGFRNLCIRNERRILLEQA